jgi:membrane protein
MTVVLDLYGDLLAERASEFFRFEMFLDIMMWEVLQWPLAFTLMLSAIAIIYRVCPDVEEEWRWVTPGVVLAVLLWLCVSLVPGYAGLTG